MVLRQVYEGRVLARGMSVLQQVHNDTVLATALIPRSLSISLSIKADASESSFFRRSLWLTRRLISSYIFTNGNWKYSNTIQFGVRLSWWLSNCIFSQPSLIV
jgi:hypothetical protein